jgi:integrase
LEDQKRGLTAREVMNAEPEPGERKLMLNCGRRLFLQIIRWPDGHLTKSWVFKYQRGTKYAKEMGLGKFPEDRTLAEARKRARELSLMLLDGQPDPIKVRKEQKAAAKAEADKVVIDFEQLMDDYLAKRERGWRSTKHREQWERSVRTHAKPLLKMLPAQIDKPAILNCIEPVWQDTPETASRTLDRIRVLLDYATDQGLRSGDNPAKNLRRFSLPDRDRTAEPKNFAAMPYDQVPAFMAELKERPDDYLQPASVALQFLILCASRTGEVVGMEWSEVDFDAKVWTVPGRRMKSGKEHTIPLSTKALAILNAQPRLDDRVFPACAEHHCRILVRKMREGITIHGFRSSFRQWAAALTDHPDIIAEQALAHTIGNEVERAYRRKSEPLGRRALMMEQWASYISTVATPAKVLPIRRKKS